MHLVPCHAYRGARLRTPLPCALLKLWLQRWEANVSRPVLGIPLILLEPSVHHRQLEAHPEEDVERPRFLRTQKTVREEVKSILRRHNRRVARDQVGMERFSPCCSMMALRSGPLAARAASITSFMASHVRSSGTDTRARFASSPRLQAWLLRRKENGL